MSSLKGLEIIDRGSIQYDSGSQLVGRQTGEHFFQNISPGKYRKTLHESNKMTVSKLSGS